MPRGSTQRREDGAIELRSGLIGGLHRTVSIGPRTTDISPDHAGHSCRARSACFRV